MKEVSHKVYDMIEIDLYLFKESKIQRQLKSCWIFEMINILRNIHIVFNHMKSNKQNFISYIDNYVDRNLCNILYNVDFIKKN